MVKYYIAATIAVVLLIGGIALLSKDQTASGTTNFNDIVADSIAVTSSPDGYVLWDDFTVSTTSPVRAALTNSTGSVVMCDGDSLAVYSDATADFAPSFKFAVGTTTSSTAYSANLISSTTVATSTDTVNSPVTWSFLLADDSSITLSVGDYVAAIASSTYYGNWSGQVSIHCWTLGQ